MFIPNRWPEPLDTSLLRFVFQVTVSEEKDGEKVTKEKTVFDPYRLKIGFDTRKFSAYKNRGMMTQVCCFCMLVSLCTCNFSLCVRFSRFFSPAGP